MIQIPDGRACFQYYQPNIELHSKQGNLRSAVCQHWQTAERLILS